DARSRGAQPVRRERASGDRPAVLRGVRPRAEHLAAGRPGASAGAGTQRAVDVIGGPALRCLGSNPKESSTPARRSSHGGPADVAGEEDGRVARCITCGTPLHPERAEKYDYCTKPACRAKNARSLTIAAVGVNKAADQFVVLDERTQEEMAGGRYLDARRASSIAPVARQPRRRSIHPA